MTHLLKHRPFDSHVHFRRGVILQAVAPFTAQQCWGAVVMPNTATPHILAPADAIDYKKEIVAAAGEDFTPVMTGYLTANTTPEMVKDGFVNGIWAAMKVYPRAAGGAGTTHSEDGVVPWELPDHPALPVMQELGIPLLIHGEVNVDPRDENETIDIYDREKEFITILIAIRKRYPKLRISMEHITSVEMADYMFANGNAETLVCTITPQHLLFDRRDLHHKGWQPGLFCYPILKRSQARARLIQLATSGRDWVFAGSDSAPHPTYAKESACGCAGGVFSAPTLTELYAEAFDKAGKIRNLESFLCINGPVFYGLKPKYGVTKIEKEPWTSSLMVGVSDGMNGIRPFGFNQDINDRHEFQWCIAV